jgi:hypothetical protein
MESLYCSVLSEIDVEKRCSHVTLLCEWSRMTGAWKL